MPKAVDHKGYPCAPRVLSEAFWFYEQPEGIVLLHGKQGENAEQIVIPWRKIEAAVERRRKLRRKSEEQ